MLITKV